MATDPLARELATSAQRRGTTPPYELMDAETFGEIYARGAHRTRPAPRAEGIVDLAELGARVLPRIPVSPAAAAALEAEIDRSSNRESVARIALYLARNYASATALLLVHRGLVQGLCAEGIQNRPDSILFPADAPGVFGEVAIGGGAFRGAPPSQGLDARVLRALGREHAQEIAVLPIALGGRVVSLLYADNGREGLGDASFAALGAVCARVAAAYGRLILARKRARS